MQLRQLGAFSAVTMVGNRSVIVSAWAADAMFVVVAKGLWDQGAIVADTGCGTYDAAVDAAWKWLPTDNGPLSAAMLSMAKWDYPLKSLVHADPAAQGAVTAEMVESLMRAG